MLHLLVVMEVREQDWSLGQVIQLLFPGKDNVVRDAR